MTCAEAQEFVAGLIDHELTDADQRAIEAHLQECSDCRLIEAQQRLVKQALRVRAERLRAPADLRNRILSDERIFPQKKNTRRWAEYLQPGSHFVSAALAAAVMLAIAVPAFYLLWPKSESIATAALGTYEALAKSEVSARGNETADAIVARLVHEAGGHPHPMGYDLSRLQMQPIGGSVHEIHGRKVLVVIYRGQGGTLFCYTFVGSEADAPAHAAKFYEAAKKMNLYAFSRGPVNAVLHREGDLICILASEMPMNELVELTRSKARAS
jgi:anti-sigma factor RsiW